MALIEFKDRVVAHPGRCILTNVTTNEQTTVDVKSAEGIVTEEGTVLNKNVMDKLAQKEEIATELNKKLNTSAVVQSTGTGTNIVMSQKAVTDAINNSGSSGGAQIYYGSTQKSKLTFSVSGSTLNITLE